MGGRKEGNIEWVRVRASCLKAKWSESEKWPETSYTRISPNGFCAPLTLARSSSSISEAKTKHVIQGLGFFFQSQIVLDFFSSQILIWFTAPVFQVACACACLSCIVSAILMCVPTYAVRLFFISFLDFFNFFFLIIAATQLLMRINLILPARPARKKVLIKGDTQKLFTCYIHVPIISN